MPRVARAIIPSRPTQVIGEKMKFYTIVFASLALSVSQSPAFADEPAAATAAAPTIKKGAWIWSSDGRRLGRIETLRNGSVSLIYGARIIYIPTSSLSATEKGLATTLTRKEIDQM